MEFFPVLFEHKGYAFSLSPSYDLIPTLNSGVSKASYNPNLNYWYVAKW